MAANCARRTLQFSSASAKTFFNSLSSSPFASKAFKLTELAAAKPAATSRFATQKLKFSRLPVELAGAQSLIPLHSATASALFTSLLSLHNNSWGCLSEGICFSNLEIPVAKGVKRKRKFCNPSIAGPMSYCF